MRFLKHIILLAMLICPATSYAAGGSEKEHKEGVPYFIELDPLIVPIITHNQSVEVLALNLILEAEDSEKSGKINDNVPRLRDGFIRSLYGRMEQDSLINKQGVLNMELLKTRLMAVANHVMEPGTVQDILLQGVTHQKVR